MTISPFYRVFTNVVLLTAVIVVVYSCKESTVQRSENTTIVQGQADKKSAVIANEVLTAMGGVEKWNSVHYLSWTFFGNRKLVWDKKGERVRIDNPRDTTTAILNLKSMTGRYSKNGGEVTDMRELAKQMKKAKSIWINDSYWLVMPFKLRDPGVQLRWLRRDTLSGAIPADVLELTFENVGDTPDNKYEVYVDSTDSLIKKWSFYKEASQLEPSATWPWDNYQSYDGLLLSSDRSDKSGPSEVVVSKTVPDSVFDSL